ncbi:MAG: outer membrane protein assembly factor BamA [Neomegalonema sp.]|nr:outer membrane protein assembly factor BamA [Neomegalonema sp.]
MSALRAALMAILLLLLPVSVSAQTINNISIEGTQRIEEATIRSYLQLREGDAVTPAKVNEALKRLFATGLFQDVAIDFTPDNTLLVSVDENPIVNQIAFEGNRAIDNEVLLAQVRSRPRTAFTRARAEADAQTVLEMYRAAGRYSAIVEPKIIELENNRVDLVFEISEGEPVGVSAINFVGNNTYSDRRLRRVVETSETAWWKILSSSDSYDPDRLEFDKELLRRFYFDRGYADFQVLAATAELNPERTGFFITFTLEEGEPYQVGEVKVVSAARGVENGPFEELLKVENGDDYNASDVQETVRDMQRYAGRESINFVDIRPRANKRRDGDTPIIDLTFEIREAQRLYVERIEIEGNVRTLDHVIRREFELAEGDAFSAYLLEQSRSDVRALGFFSSVEVTPERGSSDERVVIRTKVKERSTGDISFGLGFSSSENIGGEISITERNFLGRGQFVRASVSATTERQLFTFRFIEPYFLDRNLQAGLRAYYQQVDNQDESSFDTRELGFEPSVSFPLSDDSTISLNYRIENSEILDVPSDASPLIEQDEGARLSSSIGIGYTLDRRNDPIEPSSGFKLQLDSEVAGLGGDARYVSAEASLKGYQSFLREDVITSLELAGGGVFGFSDNLRVTDRYFLGGDSFRGFKGRGVGPRDVNSFTEGGETVSVDDALGGKYFLISRADVSFPIGLPEEYGIHGGLFADAGTLFGLDETSYTVAGNPGTFTVDDSMALRAAVGATIYWSSPIGPVRLNFALPVIKESEDETEFFRFSVGTRF